jgi:hypothetical protein
MEKKLLRIKIYSKFGIRWHFPFKNPNFLLNFRAEIFGFCTTFYSRNFFQIVENARIQIIRHIENIEIS